MLAGGAVPNLQRIVAECTQPYSAPPPAAARALQAALLIEPGAADRTYLAALARAGAAPLSEPVIAKCAALIQQNLYRHTPSRGVLRTIRASAQRLAALLPPLSDAAKSLLFLAASAARLEGSIAGGIMASGDSAGAGSGDLLRPAGGGGSDGRPPSGVPLASSFSAQSSDGARHAGSSLHGSRGGGLCPPSDAGGQDAWGGSDGSSDGGGGGGGGGSQMAAQLAAAGALRPLVGEAPPDWALVDSDLAWPQVAALAAEASMARQQEPEQPEQQQHDDLDWASLVPEYGGSLAPLLQGLYEDDENGPLPSLSASDVLATFADADAGTARLRMFEIAAARRRQLGFSVADLLEAAHLSAADSSASDSAAPTRDEHAALGPSELAVALEVVLGQSGGSSSSALGLIGDRGDAADEHWQATRPAPDGAVTPPEPLGPLCGSLLAELLVETWLTAGPDAAAPLVLRMVQGTLHSPDQAMRARVFDLLYTASIAGAALLGGAVPGGDGAVDAPAADAEPPANAFSPPGAPPEPAEQLYARPRSPSGVQRLRGGNNVPGSQLPSPRIHLPPKAMIGQADGGSSRSSVGTAGHSPASSPRPQHYAAAAGSPRSRLSRRDDVATPRAPLRSPGRASSSGSAVDELPGQLVGAFDGWLRKLVFELVSMLSQLGEASEQVWQAAAGCVLHVSTHGGYWIRDAVKEMPPAALRGVMDACLRFGWAPELHAQLSQLVPLLLRSRQSAVATEGFDIDSSRLAAFGGAQELVRHFRAAASANAQRSILLPLLQHCLPPGTTPTEAARAIVALADTPSRLRLLQTAVLSGRLGWSEPVIGAVGSAPVGDDALRLLMTKLLANLEHVAIKASGDAVAAVMGACANTAPEAALTEAVDLTRSHVAGNGVSVSADVSVAWRALRELCWCSEPDARAAAAEWLQQLLAAVLNAAEEGSMPLPLPPSSSDDAARTQSLPPGTAAFTELLAHLVGHVPGGSYLLIDALVRFLASAHTWPLSHGGGPSGAADRSSNSSGGLTPAAADLRTARGWARAWVLVMRWVSTSVPRGDARGALSRLAEVATQLLCWPPPDHAHDSSGGAQCSVSSSGGVDAVDSAAHSGGSDVVCDLASPVRVSTPQLASAFDRLPGDDASDAEESVEAAGANFDQVCQHQAFLAGRDYLSQDAVDAVGPESLVALLRRLLACPPSASADASSFGTRFDLSPSDSLLSPSGDAASDLQLTLLLFVVAACAGDEVRYAEAQIEQLMQQVLSTCTDVRACYYFSTFVLDHLVTFGQGRYLHGFKQMLVQAQQHDDERLVANPFLQLDALLRR